MRNTSTAIAQRNFGRIVTLPVSASRRCITLSPEIRRGVAAIRQLIADEAKSELPNYSAIESAQYLLDDLELLPSVAQISREQFVIFSSGIAAVARLIASQLAQPRPDLGAISHASYLIADISDLVEEELDRDA